MVRKKWSFLSIALALLLSSCTVPTAETPSPALTAAVLETPVPTPTPEPVTLLENDSAQVETARLGDGLVDVRYTGGRDIRVKVQIVKGEDGTAYNYDLNNAGDWETFSFTQGEGPYTVKVLEQVEGTTYRRVFTAELEAVFDQPEAPFLHANQFVNYTPESGAAAVAGEVMVPGETDADRVALAFDYVVDALAYDYEKADTVEKGYLPDVDAVLAEGKGICFDYAALLAAMLRSQGIPCKLEVGNAGTVYHAWVEVLCRTEGLVDGVIPITAGEWSLLDPTFVSSGDRSEEILQYVIDRDHYEVVYTY